jgi:ABC-type phosphate/phosphonate transport system ATPase subunit
MARLSATASSRLKQGQNFFNGAAKELTDAAVEKIYHGH